MSFRERRIGDRRPGQGATVELVVVEQRRFRSPAPRCLVAEILDVSVTGALLSVEPHPAITPGSRLAIRVESDQGEVEVRHGRVHGGRLLVGVRFRRLDPPLAAALFTLATGRAPREDEWRFQVSD